jgi:uncharacterized protein YbjQ (UPF0145 family)
MKLMNHHLIAAAAALGLTGSTAVAQFGSAVYGTTTRNNLALDRESNSRRLVALNSPSNGVFGAVSASVNPPTNPVAPGARAVDLAPGTASVSSSVNATAGARGVPAAPNPNLTASAALDMTDTIHAINASTVQARQSLLGDVNARMEASDHAMADLSLQAKTLRGDALANFKVAVKDVQVKEKALKRSLKTAHKAKPEAWIQVRADLAAHFNAYAEAVAHAEAVAVSERPAHTSDNDADAVATAGVGDEAQGSAMVSDDR